MKAWQEELLHAVQVVHCEHQLLERIGAAARNLGFEYCAYGMRIPRSFSNPKTILLNNYPKGWQQRYESQDYLAVDPTVAHCRVSTDPLVWSEALFADAPALWEDAQAHGLRHGWAQSSLDALGVGGMLTLARGAEPLTRGWLLSEEMKLRWLVCVAHQSLSRLLRSRHGRPLQAALSGRELEVLKWTADGKTSGEIATILAVSENTVNFHVKNAVAKMRTCNKTSAVVQAAMLGLLN
ncbi:LuxR family transcriptional regulator [Roseateles sp. DAIF2]|uniref:autoinducer binding domain-containing protein n=1 Tax=Roseateles sp. DAIF2 TaxID=2714952 RepID=UPI0018A2A65B|nr:autoinducer binding domain-containing protein [Roseateles sp. DAIF2]QPF73600.1 LuxR family transcriptional regulator [Roseateles sp. DAIF2]